MAGVIKRRGIELTRKWLLPEHMRMEASARGHADLVVQDRGVDSEAQPCDVMAFDKSGVRIYSRPAHRRSMGWVRR